MKKNLLLYILLAFLVLMNGFFLFKHFGASDNNDQQRPGPENFIAKQLELDATQLVEFKKIDKAHREKMTLILVDIKGAKDELFDKISDETINDSIIHALANQVSNKEKAKELETFHFFKSLNDICTESQKKRLKRILKDGLRRQGPPPGRNDPPDRNGPQGGPGDGNGPPPPRH